MPPQRNQVEVSCGKLREISMKKLVVLFVLCLFTNLAVAQDISGKKLSDDVLVVSGAGGNISAIRSTEGILVVDTFISPSAARKARALIEEAFPGDQIKYVINTHLHFDHTAGNQVFKDSLIVAHINNSDRVRVAYAERAAQLKGAGEKIKAIESHLADHAGKSQEELEKLKGELEEFKRIQENYGDFELVPAPFSLEAGARIESENKTYHLWYNGPGHTDGDIIVYCPEERLLIMGDLLFNRIVPYIDAGSGADVANWISILEKVIGRENHYDTVIPGHGEISTVDALREKVDYLKSLWAAVTEAKSAGKTLAQAREEITLEEFKDYARYQALSTNVDACWQILDRK
jgi:cyclase